MRMRMRSRDSKQSFEQTTGPSREYAANGLFTAACFALLDGLRQPLSLLDSTV